MKRWNISKIFFLSVAGKRRDVTLEPGVVNIITGASGTGKSTLIKAIDYCLGSSRCELPAHVRRRSVAVGVKWISGDAEIVVGRIIPPVGQATSTRMFTLSGRDLPLPTTVSEFEGATTLGAAKAFLERVFGIGDLPGEADVFGNARGRATIRHVTPYMFLTKEVICSESVLLHNLEKPDKARDIIATMPYFLRVIDEASSVNERRLRQLMRALEKEEMRERTRATSDSKFKQRANSLLMEAHRIGLIPDPGADLTEDALLVHLKAVTAMEFNANAYPSEGEFGLLHTRRRQILNSLAAARRRANAAQNAIQDASGFENVVTRQREKLILSEYFRLDKIAKTCPICDAPTERGQETARALKATLAKISSESAAVARVKPKLIEYDRAIEEEIEAFNVELRCVDDQIRSWLCQNEEAKRLADLSQLQAHLLGRISFLLETLTDEPRQPARDLNVLRSEISDLETRVDREAKEIKLRRAEAKISQFASEAFSALPTVAPCIGSEIDFSSRQPQLTVIESGSGAVLRIADVGSDQNYLAMHIALSFALQRYFEVSKSPVPALLVLDQISRPYFPTSGEDEEAEIRGGEEDEDVQAMRKHIDFLFKETARRSGMQVLLIEHAYFADDPRYVEATRERWTRPSGRALIPLDWPVRADELSDIS